MLLFIIIIIIIIILLLLLFFLLLLFSFCCCCCFPRCQWRIYQNNKYKIKIINVHIFFKYI